MTNEDRMEYARALLAFEQFPQRELLLKAIRDQLESARDVHERINDQEIPGQHRWAQGRVFGIREVLNFLQGDSHGKS